MTKTAATLVVLLGTLHATTSPAFAQDGPGLTLADAISAAKSRSPELGEARANASGAESAADAAVAGYLPSLSAQISGNRSWTRGQPGGAEASFGTTVSGSARWTAWDFGRTTSAVGSARAEARAATARVAASSNDAVRNTASLFLTAVFDEELVNTARITLRLREKHANLSRALVASGLRPPVEEGRARVEMALARLAVTAAERQLAQDRVKLATAMMIAPERAERLVRPSYLPPIVDPDPHRAAALAEERRPELREANQLVEAREEALDAAKAGRLPQIGFSLNAEYRTNRDDDITRPAAPQQSLTAMLTLSIPLFDWSVWGNVPVANANVVAAETRAAGTRARVRGQAAEATYALQAATALVEQSKSARELSSATLVVIEGRYQAGLATPFDLFDAATKDAQARTEAIRAELALSTATVDFLAATGRLNELSR